MNLNTTRTAIILVVSLALAAGMAGCRIETEKGPNGEDKKVQIDTPFGGIHVNTDQTTAADLGLPVYPGATAVTGDGDHKSADVHLGFGEWQLRVKAVSYQTSDSEDKVTAFYKKALGRYGNVITCQGNSPVGTPAITTEGLTCTDNGKHNNVQIDQGDYHFGKGGLELKAGSKHHQHIVGFESPRNNQTRFALVALDLPAEIESDSEKSN
ncbi:MAG: hypothetical protein ABSC77_03280 [Terracidiphilus sp.]|jgi:hypothetical protein